MGATVDQEESKVLSSSASTHNFRDSRHPVRDRPLLRPKRPSRRNQDDQKDNIVFPPQCLIKEGFAARLRLRSRGGPSLITMRESAAMGIRSLHPARVAQRSPGSH